MRLLVVGGTVFLGRHIAAGALARGHDVTLFHRGLNRGAPSGSDEILGDRDRDLSGLAGREWDAVIDTSAYLPRQVEDLAEALGGSAGHYTLASSISVYRDFTSPGLSEDAELAGPPAGAELDVENYGAFKAAAEASARAGFTSVTVVRPGLIVGPWDPTDRFTYWARRSTRGGPMLVPGRPERAVQLIDARDLAAWMLDVSERRVTGTFNATGLPLPMGDLVEACLLAAGGDASPVWVPDAFLLERGVEPWSELPLWLPENEPEEAGFMRVDVSRALAAGLTLRPLVDTARDTIEWDRTRGVPVGPEAPYGLVPEPAGLSAERESSLLAELAHP